MFEFAWHGSASISLRFGGAGGPVVAVDPVFSRHGDYGPWYTPNPHAPEFGAYLAGFAPDAVLITHGHFDHFDLETVKRIGAAVPTCRFGGSEEVVATMAEFCGVTRARSTVLESGTTYGLPGLLPVGEGVAHGLSLTPRTGEHWLTGEEGSRAAAKLAGRPDRYGVMPCGGPMLGFFIRQGDPRGSGDARGASTLIYISGDDRLHSFPRKPVDVAIVNFGGLLVHPVTKEPTKEITGPEDAAAVIDEYLRPGVLIPVHWDHEIFVDRVDPGRIRDSAASAAHPARLVFAPHNRWISFD